MRVPTVEVKWVRDRPRDLVCIVMRTGKTEHCGVGATLAAAFENMAINLRLHAVERHDDLMRDEVAAAEPEAGP